MMIIIKLRQLNKGKKIIIFFFLLSSFSSNLLSQTNPDAAISIVGELRAWDMPADNTYTDNTVLDDILYGKTYLFRDNSNPLFAINTKGLITYGNNLGMYSGTGYFWATSYMPDNGKRGFIKKTHGDFFRYGFTDLGGSNTTTSLTLLRDGNVGIGTTSPSERLEVTGKVKIDGGMKLGKMRNNDLTLLMENGRAYDWKRIGADGQLCFWTNGKADSDDSPQMTLDTYGNIKTNTDVGVNLWLGNAGSIGRAGWIGTTSNHGLYLGTNNLGTNLYLDTNNRVGIGTTSPEAKLHVVGDKANLEVDNLVINHGSTANNLTKVSINTDYSIDSAALTVAGLVYIANREDRDKDEQDLQGLLANQYAPFFNLWVEGNAISSDFAISEPDSWRDFVFDDDYQLPTLKEEEAFIKEHGHLSGFMSEKEVKEQGYYSISELDMDLLQKVEELMLYVIQQQKEIEELKSKLKN